MDFSTKAASRIAGVLFIIATVAAILGALLYNPILNDSEYLTQGSAHANQVVLGALMELILVVSAVGTATVMFPFLINYNKTIAIWHVCFRFMEAVVITVGIISVLSLLSLSQDYIAAGAPDIGSYQVSGTLLLAVHEWTFMLGPNFFLGINTMMYSYIFYKSKLVPRSISLLGMIGSVLIFLVALLEMFGVVDQLSVWGGILALPVFAYEMVLAFWLITRGFNVSAIR
ncbi:DUF4386 domain-containing protein [Paenibacillus sp. 2TAB23]|uniref:DUF4386 domain-containing protein n=1 Tax=Paenibacillus sp. 2TAB23 TaxID=3233004 RepID=UPI003F9D2E66